MGNAVSSDNDALTDNLVQVGLINDANTERVLRLVDRGNFMVGAPPTDVVYRDHPWLAHTGTPGWVKLSAPSIYSLVLAHLDLRPGLSFLNVGSGSGFLSTAVGFLLGSNGKNHGIELHSNILEHAEECWHRMLARPEVSAFDIAMPRFACGNALSLACLEAKYDRIYIGAGVRAEDLGSFLPMLKTGGVLIVPIGNELLRYEITGTATDRRRIHHVQFAQIVRPRREDGQEKAVADAVVDSDASEALLREFNPKSLLSLCVDVVRNSVRNKLKGQKDVQMREMVGRRQTLLWELGVMERRGAYGDHPELHLEHVDDAVNNGMIARMDELPPVFAGGRRDAARAPERTEERERAEDEEDSDDVWQEVRRRRIDRGEQWASLHEFDLEFRSRLWSLDAPEHIRVSLLLGVPYEETKEEEEEKEEQSASAAGGKK